jgi:lipoprotein NlpI
MRSRWTLLFVLMHITGFIGAATAQTLDQQQCSAPDPDLSITGCTAMIRSGRETPQNLTAAFYNRGRAYANKGQYERAIEDLDQAIRLNPNVAQAFSTRGAAYANKGQYDRAIQDYDQAIRLNPNFAVAFSNRGDAYRAKGDNDRAIADLNEAIRLDPNFALAYFNRGLAYLYSANSAKALADVIQASEFDQKNAYNALWVDIVGQRNNIPSRLSQAIAKIDMKAWPAPVIRLFLGQMTPAAVLAAADDPDATKKKGQVCEANFLRRRIGAAHGREGRGDPAVPARCKRLPEKLRRMGRRQCGTQGGRWDAVTTTLSKQWIA